MAPGTCYNHRSDDREERKVLDGLTGSISIVNSNVNGEMEYEYQIASTPSLQSRTSTYGSIFLVLGIVSVFNIFGQFQADVC